MTISVCMIVKDEEKCLARCLDSLDGIYDELIIVDTGSTDSTKEIARRYTNKLYDFSWTGSFADARNFSFSKATCDYIYCADADEEIDKENRAKFLTLKSTILPQIEIVQMYYCNQLQNNTIYSFDRELRPKLYKRLREFTWIDPIHERVNPHHLVYDSDIEIIHRPTSLHANRDLGYFEKMIYANEVISPRLLDIYEKELYIAGEKENLVSALPYFEALCDTDGLTQDELMKALTISLKASRLSENLPLQLKYALRGVASDGCSELCLELGHIFYNWQMFEEAALWYYNAAFETEPLLYIESSKSLPLKGLVDSYIALGNDELASTYQEML